MRSDTSAAPSRRLEGMALMLAMVFLLLLTLLAGKAIRATALAFRLAGNEQSREQAQQYAEAIIAEVTAVPANFPLSAAIGDVLCKPSRAGAAGCSGVLTRPATVELSLPRGMAADYRVIRKGPELLGRLPVRLDQSAASSSRAYRAAVFEVQAEVNGNNVQLGSADIAQGVAVLVPWGGQ